jgi:hypothetical protein
MAAMIYPAIVERAGKAFSVYFQYLLGVRGARGAAVT